MNEKIYKADTVARKVVVSSPKILKREVYDASLEARDVISAARHQASQIIADAEREREIIRAQAREEGQAQGLAEWNAILARSVQRAEELEKKWEAAMLQLSVRVAEKIIGEQLTLEPDRIVAIVREVLRGTRPGKHVTLQVNDSEAQQVRSHVDRLKQVVGANCDIEIVGSASIAAGGCVVESELGIIDARLETQLKCLEDVLVRAASHQ